MIMIIHKLMTDDIDVRRNNTYSYSYKDRLGYV